jgi:superkiller protein 3
MKRARAVVRAALAVCTLAACASPPASDPGAVAAEYARQGRWDEAGRAIQLAVRQHPRDASLRRQAADILRHGGRPAEAVRHLELAIQIEPEEAEAWIALGDLEKARENIQDAYVAYRRAAELAPRDLRAVSGLALTADSLGFEEEAEDAYRRWAELEREYGTDTVPRSAR